LKLTIKLKNKPKLTRGVIRSAKGETKFASPAFLAPFSKFSPPLFLYAYL